MAGALQALDPDQVVYMGTAAKTLAPGVRLGWVVLPPSLLHATVAIRAVADRYSPVLDQLALEQLIEDGDFDRHIRAMRGRYRRRRDLLVDALREAAPGLPVGGVNAGLQAILELPAGTDEHRLITAAAERSIGLLGLSEFRHGSYRGAPALVVGFGTPPEHGFGQAVRALSELLSSELGSLVSPDLSCAQTDGGDAFGLI
jgi:GntR family transcriptional regulator / MocR family aminotransferase